jgi:hypothetical protein
MVRLLSPRPRISGSGIDREDLAEVATFEWVQEASTISYLHAGGFLGFWEGQGSLTRPQMQNAARGQPSHEEHEFVPGPGFAGRGCGRAFRREPHNEERE